MTERGRRDLGYNEQRNGRFHKQRGPSTVTITITIIYGVFRGFRRPPRRFSNGTRGCEEPKPTHTTTAGAATSTSAGSWVINRWNCRLREQTQGRPKPRDRDQRAPPQEEGMTRVSLDGMWRDRRGKGTTEPRNHTVHRHVLFLVSFAPSGVVVSGNPNRAERRRREGRSRSRER
jgi:hypothetical protein